MDKLTWSSISSNKKQEGLFNELQKREFSGRMILESAKGLAWTFYFYLGRIIYATGGTHPVRRYQRNLSIYLPQVLSQWKELSKDTQISEKVDKELSWEYGLLNLWLQQKKIEAKEVNQFINAQVQEILFDITQTAQVTIRYEEDKSYKRPLSLINPEQITLEAWKLRQSWQNAKLADRNPDYAPLIVKPEELKQKVSSKTFESMIRLLDGSKSIRDLIVQLPQQNIVQFTSLLQPYVQTGLIELVKIEDLQSPIQLPTAYIPLIACIDDNVSICETMKSIITANNYRFLGISDELRAINILLKQKPDMIFLDFVMPKINGYELCGMLRKVPEFRDKPIIILSAYNNIVEHFRGKVSGCSGFVYKPIETENITSAIAQYLAKSDDDQTTSKNPVSKIRPDSRTDSSSFPSQANFCVSLN